MSVHMVSADRNDQHGTQLNRHEKEAKQNCKNQSQAQ